MNLRLHVLVLKKIIHKHVPPFNFRENHFLVHGTKNMFTPVFMHFASSFMYFVVFLCQRFERTLNLLTEGTVELQL